MGFDIDASKIDAIDARKSYIEAVPDAILQGDVTQADSQPPPISCNWPIMT